MLVESINKVTSKMKILVFLIILLQTQIAFGQNELCRTDILNSLEVGKINILNNLNNQDFSEIWMKTNDELIFGIIGKEHQRILIKFLTVEKNINNPSEYFISGKTNVKDNICDFVGKITLQNIQEIISENYGVDDEYKNSKIKLQGLITAKYEFFENKKQKHSGYFSGTMQSLFYIDENDQIQYNDISIVSDGYFNNSFVGKWKMYNSDLEKICNWGDYRVPNSNCDFDIGIGEFNVSEKYWKKGWLDIALKNKISNGAIVKKEPNKIQKKWWE